MNIVLDGNALATVLHNYGIHKVFTLVKVALDGFTGYFFLVFSETIFGYSNLEVKVCSDQFCSTPFSKHLREMIALGFSSI